MQQRIAKAGGHFTVETDGGPFAAQNVLVMAGIRAPRIPATSAGLPGHEYGKPQQMPDAAVLVVGTEQFGGQMTEDLPATAPSLIYPGPHARGTPAGTAAGTPLLVLQINRNGPDRGINGL